MSMDAVTSRTKLRTAWSVILATVVVGACATTTPESPMMAAAPAESAGPPTPDPRVGLGSGLLDAEEAIWNLRMVSTTPTPPA